MDAFHEDYKASGKAKLKAYEVEHDSLTQALVESLMKQDIDYVGNLCGLDVSLLSSPILVSPPNTNLYLPLPFVHPCIGRRVCGSCSERSRHCYSDTLTGTRTN